MNLHRVAEEKYSDLTKLLNGQGAIGGGRWNPPHLPASYFGLQEDTSVAEKGYYTITARTEIFNLNFAGKPSIPSEYIDTFIGKEFTLSCLECVLPENLIIDISTETRFAEFCRECGITMPFRSAIQNGWFSNSKTQQIGMMACNKGYGGLIVKSARHIEKCMAIYPTNLADMSNFKIVAQVNTKLSCQPIDYDGPYDPTKDGPMAQDRLRVEKEAVGGGWGNHVVRINPW